MFTLYSLCLDFVNKNFKWKVDTSQLPVSVERDILLHWFECTEELDLSDEELSHVLQICGNNWSNILPITTDKFVMLMCLPKEVPSFAFDSTHVILEYYIMSTDNCTQSRNLCYQCYSPIAKEYKDYSENVWYEKGWIFEHNVTHLVVNGEDLLTEIIWYKKAWCERCIITPLFVIHDYYECRDGYHFHDSKRKYNSDSETEDEDNFVRYKKRVIGNRIDPKHFNNLKKYGLLF